MASLGAFGVSGGICGNINANSYQGRKLLILEALNLNFTFFFIQGTNGIVLQMEQAVLSVPMPFKVED